jgi:hypothetical protein
VWWGVVFCDDYVFYLRAKVKIVGPGRQPGDFLSKAKESNQRTLCAALGISCLGWSVCLSVTVLDEQDLFCFVFAAELLW